uniref:Putative secreted protein n=1 Tax=Ixodes ricinus TaxID=34613 RepID=A0A6B0TYF5_IXORI
MGPRTAYSIVFKWGFILSSVTVLPAIVEVVSAVPKLALPTSAALAALASRNLRSRGKPPADRRRSAARLCMVFVKRRRCRRMPIS